jgi:hypothetical protein
MLVNKQSKQEFNLEIFFRTRKYLIFTIGFGLLSVGLLFLAAIPQFKQAWSLRSQHQSELPKLAQLKQKLASLEGVRFSPEFAQIGLVNQALPSKKPLLDLMVSLNGIAISSDATIESFELSPGLIASDAATANAASKIISNQGDVDTLEVTMVVTGNNAAVQKFILDVEKMAPFTTITQLSLSSLLQEGDEIIGFNDLREAHITTSTFFFTKSIQAAVEAPLPEISMPEREVLTALADLIPTNLPSQTTILGGGLEDLFGVDPLLFE